MGIPARQIGWSTEANLLWEIANQTQTLVRVIGAGGGGGGAVSSVNGQTGAVNLTAADIPSIGTTYVPYTGASNDLNLGTHTLYGTKIYSVGIDNSIFLSMGINGGNVGGLYNDENNEIIAEYSKGAKTYTYANGEITYNDDVKKAITFGTATTNRIYFKASDRFVFLGGTDAQFDVTDAVYINGQRALTEATGVSQGVGNGTGIPLLLSDLNTLYDLAQVGFSVYCDNISTVYTKTPLGWMSQPYTVVI